MFELLQRCVLGLSVALLLACAADELDASRLDGQVPSDELDGSYADALVADAGSQAASPLDAGAPDATLATGPEPGALVGITASHNDVRAAVNTSTALPALSWSPAIAEVAQRYADKLAARCAFVLEHSAPEQRLGYGENLAAFADKRLAAGLPGSARETVELWASELACYTYGPFASGVNERCTAACGMYGGCGHYTQLVWRGTRKVGCGVAQCQADGELRSFWVCHYDPTGNVLGELPY